MVRVMTRSEETKVTVKVLAVRKEEEKEREKAKGHPQNVRVKSVAVTPIGGMIAHCLLRRKRSRPLNARPGGRPDRVRAGGHKMMGLPGLHPRRST